MARVQGPLRPRFGLLSEHARRGSVSTVCMAFCIAGGAAAMRYMDTYNLNTTGWASWSIAKLFRTVNWSCAASGWCGVEWRPSTKRFTTARSHSSPLYACYDNLSLDNPVILIFFLWQLNWQLLDLYGILAYNVHCFPRRGAACSNLEGIV